jgi:aminoglycoside phosphotransferase (APT) family kinase protein
MDETREVRSGEELDLLKLRTFLREKLDLPDVFDLTVRQFPGGYSNLTYLIRCGDRELVLRRPPFGSKVKSAHDMGREFRILSQLSPVYPRAPRPLVFCDDESVIGARFYVMERIRGLILRRMLPPGLDLTEARMRALCDAFLDTLAELHAIDYQAVGLGDLGRPEGYVERQVSGWAKRYRDAQTDEVPAIERVTEWLTTHLPASPPATLLHNDYKFDNLVLHPDEPTRIIGILDWEMATLGDPLMDLGTSLSYWVESGDPVELQSVAFGPTTRAGSPTRRELADMYAARTGRDVSNILFYYCFGLWKNAVVVQQIYYRYKQGLTQDPRFAMLGAMAAKLTEHASSCLDTNRI